jgi:hypothetical protein
LDTWPEEPRDGEEARGEDLAAEEELGAEKDLDEEREKDGEEKPELRDGVDILGAEKPDRDGEENELPRGE